MRSIMSSVLASRSPALRENPHEAAQRHCKANENHNSQDEYTPERPAFAAAARPVVAALLSPPHSRRGVRRNVLTHAQPLQE